MPSQNPLNSPNWTSESSVARAGTRPASGSGSPSVSGSGNKKGVNLSVSPNILCCGTGKTITATATATGDDDQNTEVTLTCPDGTYKGKGSVSHTYQVKDSDCGTVLSFSASGGTETKEDKVPVVMITTKTFASVPEPRNRLKLGVMEANTITVTPGIGEISWKLEGTGKLNAFGHTALGLA